MREQTERTVACNEPYAPDHDVEGTDSMAGSQSTTGKSPNPPPRTSARDRFHTGQRVVASALGIERNLFVRGPRRGVVVGFGRRPNILGVVKDGTKSRGAYHMDFWEPDHE